MDAPAWISAVCAVLSLGGAGYAWWWANKSSAARIRAEQAARGAESAERQARSLQQIAEGLAGPLLTCERTSQSHAALRNASRREVTITEVVNRGLFAKIVFPVPITLHPGQCESFAMASAWGQPSPVDLVLRLADGQQIHVPLL